MPFHQKVDTEARLSRMIEDMGITLNPKKPDNKQKDDEKDSEKKQDNQ